MRDARPRAVLAAALTAVLTAVIAPCASASAAPGPRCEMRYHGPRIERDQFGFWIDYGAKNHCDRPVDFSMRASLRQDVGGGWIVVDYEVNRGVDQAPWVNGTIQCRHDTLTRYDVVVEARADRLESTRTGGSAVLPCSL